MIGKVAALWMLCVAAPAFSQKTPDATHPTAACGDEKTSFQVSRGPVGDTTALRVMPTIELDLVRLPAGWRIADIAWDDKRTLKGLYAKP